MRGSRVAAAFRGLSACLMPASHGAPPLADVPYCHRRDGPPELVIRRKHAVIAMPVLPRQRDKVRQSIKKLKWREFDDAVGPRPRGNPPATLPNLVGGLAPGQHVADGGDAAVWAAVPGESLEGERGPGAVPQQMFETPKTAGHIAVDKRDPDTGVD